MQSEQWGFSQLKKLPLWFLPLVCAMDKMVLSVSLALGGRKLFAAEIKQEDPVQMAAETQQHGSR